MTAWSKRVRWLLLTVTHACCVGVGVYSVQRRNVELEEIQLDIASARTFIRAELAYELNERAVAEAALLAHLRVLERMKAAGTLNLISRRGRLICLAMRATLVSPRNEANKRDSLFSQVASECRAAEQNGCGTQDLIALLQKRYPESPWIVDVPELATGGASPVLMVPVRKREGAGQ